MTKEHILDEIKRTARANGNVPLGRERFFTETGIKDSEWYGKFWARWSDAIREAGFVPNKLNEAYDEVFLLGKYSLLTRELGRLPAGGDLRLKARTDKTFPSHNTFERFGSKSQLVARLSDHCRGRGDLEDVLRICEEFKPSRREKPAEVKDPSMGYVYLSRSGRFYKIGKTNSVGRREWELTIQLPEKIKTVHAIRTDDPGGIEAYWHQRFASKRKNGEWFDLSAADVAAFKRRKFM